MLKVKQTTAGPSAQEKHARVGSFDGGFPMGSHPNTDFFIRACILARWCGFRNSPDMNPAYLPVFVAFLLPILVLVLVLVMARQAGKKWDRCLENLAGRLGLTFIAGESYLPRLRALAFLHKRSSLAGLYKGRETVVSLVVRGAGKNKQQFSSLRVATNNNQLELKVAHRGFFANLSFRMEFFTKSKIVKMGDVELDRTFLIRSSDADLARILLTTPEIRRALLGVWAAHKVRGTLCATAGGLAYEERGTLVKSAQVERFAAMADFMILLADALDAAADMSGAR
jgi:hypothetical protein